ncbi:erythromycin esterase family protein [Echinicola sp. CAU 1574]|uniref:Erythromycin esterase family protein n=1 Tax=Echinicola arenosa TaxID=2774144 RepID=A0ABR9ALY5_9BACT|nr:erythromycin esterase family protein [Echinicola arenosa]MBD8489825.1 erythromycin esterase family protein [Echinicola arenosa]
MRTANFYLVILMTFFISCSNPVKESKSDIYNFSFDKYNSYLSTEGNWQFGGCYMGMLNHDTINVKEGYASGKIEVQSPQHFKEMPYYVFQKVPLPGEFNKINISFWMKTDLLAESNFTVVVQDQDETTVNHQKLPLSRSKDWKLVNTQLSVRGGKAIFLKFDVKPEGVLWLDDMEITVEGKGYYEYLDEMIGLQSEQETVKSESIKEFPSEIGNIIEDIGDSRIIGLGESSHGVEEMQEAKNEMVKALIEQGNCNLVMFELPDLFMLKMNDYVLGKTTEGFPQKTPQVGFFGLTVKNKELFDWIREYNLKNKTKVSVAGMDFSLKWRELVEKKIKEYKEGSCYKGLWHHSSKLYPDSLYNYIKNNQKKLEAEAGKSNYRQLLEYSQGYNQALNVLSVQLYPQIRDSIMANNVINLVEKNLKKGEKGVVYGHLSHINRLRTSNSDFVSLGNRLAKHFGDQYFAIGILVGEGEVQGMPGHVSGDNKTNIQELSSPHPLSIEKYCMDQSISPFYSNINDIPSLGDQMLMYRFVGGQPRENQFFPGNIFQRLDGIIWLPKGSPLKLLPYFNEFM